MNEEIQPPTSSYERNRRVVLVCLGVDGARVVGGRNVVLSQVQLVAGHLRGLPGLGDRRPSSLLSATQTSSSVTTTIRSVRADLPDAMRDIEDTREVV